MELNPRQKEAVEHKSGPLLIIAGAGTGKTKVITERIAHIINERWAHPSEILALTFTEKAANEMQERIDMIMPLGYEQPTLSTFHSFADKLLKQEGIFIGLDSNYSLMTQSESYILFRRHLFDFPLLKFRPLGNPTRFISDILSHFSRLQDEDVSPEDYIAYAKALPEGNDSEREARVEAIELSQTYKQYNDIKVLNSKLDFGDLIITVLKLLRKKPNILQKYHEKYKYILVDEYQDTNYTQNVLVNLLVLGKDTKEVSIEDRNLANITVVGDDDQSIYKFRGAAISNILQFKEIYPNAKNIVLTENYRSSQAILDSSYRLIKNNDPYRLEITEKVDKRLVSQVSAGDQNSLKIIHTSNNDEENERIADEILSLVGKTPDINTEFNSQGQGTFMPDQKKYSYNDIAILARANSHIDEIVETLRYREIPYKLGGSKSLYLRPEIRTLISYLKTISNYSLNVDMFNILSMKEWKFTPRDIVEIVRYTKENDTSIFETLEIIAGRKAGEQENEEKKDLVKVSALAKAAALRILEIYDEGFKMIADNKAAGEILFRFFEKSGLKDKYLAEETGKYAFAVENIQKYFDMLHKFWRNNKGTNLFEYLDYLNYSMEVGESPRVDSSSFDEYDAVNVLTVHSAKGLEFPVVFVVNMVSDRFPSRDRRDVIPIPDALIKELLPTGGEISEHIMEERRLAYVAYTRAKERLYLTASDYYSEGKRKKKLSQFLTEALEDGNVVPEAVVKVKEKEITVKEEKELMNFESIGVKVGNVFSYTQLHTYEQCPRMYKYEYILKMPVPMSAAASFGTTVHNTLKNIYDQLKLAHLGLEGMTPIPTEDDFMNAYKKNWVALGYESKKHELQRFESGKKFFKEYYKTCFSADENPLFLERGFDYAMDDFRIKGRIDRIDLLEEKDGEIHVELIDYKTGKTKDEKEVNKEWQLLFYAIVVEETMGLKVDKVSYMFVESCKKVPVKLNPKKKGEILSNIREIVGKIRKGDFTVPQGHDCRFCNFNDICDDPII